MLVLALLVAGLVQYHSFNLLFIYILLEVAAIASKHLSLVLRLYLSLDLCVWGSLLGNTGALDTYEKSASTFVM